MLWFMFGALNFCSCVTAQCSTVISVISFLAHLLSFSWAACTLPPCASATFQRQVGPHCACVSLQSDVHPHSQACSFRCSATLSSEISVLPHVLAQIFVSLFLWRTHWLLFTSLIAVLNGSMSLKCRQLRVEQQIAAIIGEAQRVIPRLRSHNLAQSHAQHLERIWVQVSNRATSKRYLGSLLGCCGDTHSVLCMVVCPCIHATTRPWSCAHACAHPSQPAAAPCASPRHPGPRTCCTSHG